MSDFDLYIEELQEYVDSLEKKGRRIRKFGAPPSPEMIVKELPIRIGNSSKPEVILRGDTFIELGGPSAGSCAFTLWTENASLVQDGNIILIGPDIPESSAASLPFGQVLMLGGTELDEKEQGALELTGYLGGRIEGYMIRSSISNLWARVDNRAAAKGFCFEMLGKALIAVYKSNHPKIESMEVVFVTASKEDIKLLEGIAAQVQKISKEITKTNWRIKGYDIDCPLDCNSCDNKQVCDDIREILRKRKAANRGVKEGV